MLNLESISFADNGKRRNPAEIADYLFKEFGIEYCDGFKQISDYKGAVPNYGYKYIFSNYACKESWILEQVEGNRLSWFTDTPGNKKIPLDSKCDVLFGFFMGMGNLSPLPQPTGQYDLYFNGIKALSFCVVKHAETWKGNEGQSLTYYPKMMSFAKPEQSLYLDDMIKEASYFTSGIAMLRVPRNQVLFSAPNTICIAAAGRAPSKLCVKIENTNRILGYTDLEDIIRQVAAGKRISEISGKRVYFGDIHTHSEDGVNGNGCGTGTITENYEYAKNIANLDIYSLTDHDYQMDDEIWNRQIQASDNYYSPDKFVTILGFEWTSSLYGHRNVYYNAGNFMNSGLPFYMSRNKPGDYWTSEADTPYDLWSKLDNIKAEAITIPHHTSAASLPLSWEFFSKKYDRLVEVYSSWGNSEFHNSPYSGGGKDRHPGLSCRAGLNKGLRFGLIASSDGHDGHPGFAQSPQVKHHHIYHPLGSGRIAVISDELTRNSIFQSMKQRYCYGTSGEPIILNMTLNGLKMGSEAHMDKDEKSEIDIQVKCTAPVKHIDIICNGEVVCRDTPFETCFERSLKWKDNTCESQAYYYTRITQIDGETAWSSPIWVDRKD